MKRITFISALICLTISIKAQQKLRDAVVPALVRSNFERLYPHTKVEFWTKENDNYIAEFDKQKAEMTVFMKSNGNLIKTETRISTSMLPKEAYNYIVQLYPGKKISDAVKTTDPAGNKIYEAEVGEMDLIFDGNGKFIKSVKERPVN